MSQHRSARLPDFIAVGPARTGTTWLHKALKRRVQLPAGVKETHFFNYHYSKGIGWYESHFLHCYEDLPVGEICASYFRSGPARRRISQHLPRCRIICTVRDPVERIYSFYKLMRQNGRLKGTFEQALQDYPAMLNANHYAVHIGKWQKYFGKENVMVAVFDDLEDDSQEYLNRIASFIGIPPINLAGLRIKDEKVNTRTQAPRTAGLARMAYIVRKSLNRHRLYGVKKFLDRAGVWHFCSAGGEHFLALNPVFEMRLRNMLRPEIDALEELLQRDLSAWKAGEPNKPAWQGVQNSVLDDDFVADPSIRGAYIVVSGSMRKRSGLPESRDRKHYDARADCLDAVVSQAHPGGCAGGEVLDKDVDVREQFLDDRLCGGLLQIEQQAFLAAVVLDEGGAAA